MSGLTPIQRAGLLYIVRRPECSTGELADQYGAPCPVAYARAARLRQHGWVKHRRCGWTATRKGTRALAAALVH